MINVRLPYRHSSASCDVQTDVSDAFARYIASFVDVAVPVISSVRFHAPKRDGGKRVRVWAWGCDQTFWSVFPNRGSFIDSHDDIALRGVLGSLYETRRRLLHELVHLAGRRSGVIAAPHALKEGFADIISLHSWNGTILKVNQPTGVGEEKLTAHAHNLRGWLARGLDFSLPLRRADAHLGLSAAAANFLLNDADPALSAAFDRYIVNCQAKATPETAFRLAFDGIVTAEVQQRFRTHVEALLISHAQTPLPADLNTPLKCIA
jgi:hypothetical protein